MGQKAEQTEHVAEDNTLPAENKKHKKHKKNKHDDSETDPAAFIPPASDQHKEKKKKKKKRKVDSDCSIEEGCDSSPAKKSKFLTETPSAVVQECEDTETKRSKKRKHKERFVVENEDGDPATSPVKCSKAKASDEVAVSTVDQDDEGNCTNHADSKKKKKKPSRGEKDQSEAAALQSADDDDDHSEHSGSIPRDTTRSEKKRKKKHKKSKEVENCEDVENGDCSVEEMGDRRKKKRNKKSGEINVSVLSASGVAGDDDNSPIKVKKKKDKNVKKNDVDDFQSTSNNEELKECKMSFSADLLTETMEPPKKKSKKSKHEKEGIENLCEAEYEIEHSSCDGEGKKKSKKARKTDKRDHLEEDNSQLENGISQDCNISASEKKQKKIEKQKKVKSETSTTEANTSAVVEDSCKLGDVNRKEKKKKKKDLAKQLQEGDLRDCNGVPEEETIKKKNKKKKKERPESNLRTTDQSGTSTEKQRDDSSSNSTGGQAEDNQTNTSQPEQTQPVTAGQWSTRMFRSAERQEKFLRLLGGFKKGGESSMPGQKKGLFGSLQAKADSTSGGQKALTYQTARDMDKRLESDFERALAFSAKKQRGVGLGFTPDPSEGKKFHIDVNKNASRKF